MYYIRISWLACWGEQSDIRFFFQTRFTAFCFNCTHWKRVCNFLRINWHFLVECRFGHLSSTTLLFFSVMLPKEIHGHRSKKTITSWPFAAINPAKQYHQQACHSLPLFCKSRLVHCKANFIFYLFFLKLMFLTVDMASPSPPLPSPYIPINEACSLYWSTLHTITRKSLFTIEWPTSHAEVVRDILRTKP